MAYTSKSGKRRTVSAAKAEQFNKMAQNWQERAERSGNPNDYAVAAKQALVAAFYSKHSGDDTYARAHLLNAEHLRTMAKGATDKRTLKWIMAKMKPTRKLVDEDEGFEGYSGLLGDISLATVGIGLGLLVGAWYVYSKVKNAQAAAALIAPSSSGPSQANIYTQSGIINLQQPSA